MTAMNSGSVKGAVLFPFLLAACMGGAITLDRARPDETLDLGPACEGGYASFRVTDFAKTSSGAAPSLRLVYATHPDGLGPKGDFWRETAARYLGEEVDLPILPANIDRYENYVIDRKGDYRAPLLQGLVRYVKLTLENAADGARVELSDMRLVNDRVHSEGERAGSFSCSDERLNRVWEASVRACELSAIPSYEAKHVTPPVTTRPYLADGAKRDRLVWSGDLWWAQRNVYYGFRTTEPYMSGSLELLAANRTPEGYVQACPWPEQKPPNTGEYGPFSSDEFAAWFIPVAWDHHLYRGDRALLEREWTTVRDLIGYLRGHVRADGIFEQRRETSKHACDLAFGTTSCHHRSYMNILLWLTYSDAAKIADALGHATEAAAWRGFAAQLADSIRREFWNRRLGAFALSIEDGAFGFEANALALAAGFATEAEAKTMMPRLTWVQHGKFQALAARGRFRYGDAAGALEVIGAHNWFALVSPEWRGAHLTSECAWLVHKGWGDEAHPDTAIAGILSAAVLGIEPLEPGFAKFRFAPPAGTHLAFAKGRVPTPAGDIVASWEKGADGRIVRHLTKPDALVCVDFR